MRTLMSNVQPNPNLGVPPSQNIHHFLFYLARVSKQDFKPAKVDELSPEEALKAKEHEALRWFDVKN